MESALCVNSQALAWCFGALCHGQMDPGKGTLQPCYDIRDTLCLLPDASKLLLWRKLWATVKCPVIRIPRKKTLIKKFKIKSWRLRWQLWWNLKLHKHRRERQIIDTSFDGNFGEFGPFLWDLWSFELERSALESPAFPFFLLLVQLKILNVE